MYVKLAAEHQLIKEHSGCPSCLAHFRGSKDFREHVLNKHTGAIPLQSNQTVHIAEEQPEASTSSKRSLEGDTEPLASVCLSFSPPGKNDHLAIDHFNAIDGFHQLQVSLPQQEWKSSLEDHIHYALACISILFLSPNKYLDDLLPLFDAHNLSATINHIEHTYNINKPPMPTKTVMYIIKEVLDGTATQEMVVLILPSKMCSSLPKQ